MTLQQALWAQEHDWWSARRELPNGDFEVAVLDRMDYVTRYFTDFKELRAWAGY